MQKKQKNNLFSSSSTMALREIMMQKYVAEMQLQLPVEEKIAKLFFVL
jgi:hypothetical protein